MAIPHLRRPRALLAASVVAPLLVGCAGVPRAEEEGLQSRRAVQEAHEELPGIVLTRRHIVLDASLRLTAAAPDSHAAESALAAGFQAADSVHKLVSLHVPGSEVDAINAAAGLAPVRVSPWTEAIIATALEWAERTGGAFDPTVGSLMAAWGFGGGEVVVPRRAELEAARALVGWNKVRLDRAAHTVFLSDSGMLLDLRALAKGFALDRMREAMMTAGATHGIADFDGDLMFFGHGTQSRQGLWPLEIPDPYDPTRSFARLELPPGSLSTSAYYGRVIEIEGERYGHLLDPRTGWPSRGLVSVSVYAPEAVVGDVLSTALYVLGPAEGQRLAEPLHDVEAIFVTDAPRGRSSRVVLTAGFHRYLKKLDSPTRPASDEIE